MRVIKTVTLFFRNEQPVILQELEDDHYARYCVQYRGGGHYFKTIVDAVRNINSRWQKRKGFIPKCSDSAQRWSPDELLKSLEKVKRH